MADESDYGADVAPDIEEQSGTPKPPIWTGRNSVRTNASIIPSPFNTAVGNRNLTIYDLIEFGPYGSVVGGHHDHRSRRIIDGPRYHGIFKHQPNERRQQ